MGVRVGIEILVLLLVYYLIIMNNNSYSYFDSSSVGVYNSEDDAIFLQTKGWSDQYMCMVFLHELGHRRDNYENNFLDKNTDERELYANIFMYKNMGACKDLDNSDEMEVIV